jgi:glycosyltransferase involved in cell wall biosynthesis
LKLIINATNVHQGGGRTLLLALLAATSGPTVALVDHRLTLPVTLPPTLRIIPVRSTLVSRFMAEKSLPDLCESDDVLLCFGNLPPLFPTTARTFVYLQNRYLTARRSLNGLAWQVRLRVMVERLWLRNCLRDAMVMVQTASVAEEVRISLGRDALVAPFAPQIDTPDLDPPREYDYLYAASGEGHKNHRRLVEAWEKLAELGHFPSLRLTLDESRDFQLLNWVKQRVAKGSLRITNASVEPEAMPDLYGRSKALIYPSLFESFGLPLVEAQRAGLDIVAAERDYVRDLVVPIQTFDPESSLSIARALLRHSFQDMPLQDVPSANAFLAVLLESR